MRMLLGDTSERRTDRQTHGSGWHTDGHAGSANNTHNTHTAPDRQTAHSPRDFHFWIFARLGALLSSSRCALCSFLPLFLLLLLIPFPRCSGPYCLASGAPPSASPAPLSHARARIHTASSSATAGTLREASPPSLLQAHSPSCPRADSWRSRERTLQSSFRASSQTRC